jgi:hypothetical protein
MSHRDKSRKDIQMQNNRRRILELALESLENKKKLIDQEIAEIVREFRGGAAKKTEFPSSIKTVSSPRTKRKKPRFSKEEKLRRSERMKSYWANLREKK